MEEKIDRDEPGGEEGFPPLLNNLIVTGGGPRQLQAVLSQADQLITPGIIYLLLLSLSLSFLTLSSPALYSAIDTEVEVTKIILTKDGRLLSARFFVDFFSDLRFPSTVGFSHS